MKILLIYPYWLEQRTRTEDVVVPPIGIYYVGAVLKENNYDVEILNWHDRVTAPTLSEAQQKFDGLVLGGINDQTTIGEGTPEEVAAEAKDAIEQTGGRRVLVGPGCVIPTNTTDANVRAVIDTVQSMAA